MSTHPKISILVPIYNVEQYLPQCLDSLVNQTLTDLEIICINDGSTDSSLAIIKKYQKSDSRIKLINKKNSGYGDSMNQGLKQATGTYIGIVEPDDYIDLNAFEQLTQLAKKFSADVVKANYYLERTQSSTIKAEITPALSARIIRPDDPAYRELFHFAPAIWSAIYRRDFLLKHDITFLPTPGASYQDVSFSFKVWSLAKKVVLTNQAYIHYRIDNEASSVNNPGKVYCVVEEYAEIERFLQEHHLASRLGSAMAMMKFANYHWNLQRLSPQLAQEFFPVMRAELLDAKKRELFERADFSWSKWFALQAILRYPRLAYTMLRARAHLKH